MQHIFFMAAHCKIDNYTAELIIPDREYVIVQRLHHSAGWSQVHSSWCPRLRFSAFEVYPATVSLGEVELGRRYPLKLHVTNAGGRSGSFRVDCDSAGVGTGGRER